MRDPQNDGRLDVDRYCKPWGPVPYMTPPDFPGAYTVPLPKRCTGSLGARESKPQSAPVIYVKAASEPHEQFAEPWKGPTTTHATEQGPITLPKPSTYYSGYMPTSETLRRAPFSDSRMLPFSGRYYRGPLTEPCVRSKASIPSTHRFLTSPSAPTAKASRRSK